MSELARLHDASQQALWELVTNIMDAVPIGDQVSIQVHGLDVNGTRKLAVADNGKGVLAQEQAISEGGIVTSRLLRLSPEGVEYVGKAMGGSPYSVRFFRDNFVVGKHNPRDTHPLIQKHGHGTQVIIHGECAGDDTTVSFAPKGLKKPQTMDWMLRNLSDRIWQPPSSVSLSVLRYEDGRDGVAMRVQGGAAAMDRYADERGVVEIDGYRVLWFIIRDKVAGFAAYRYGAWCRGSMVGTIHEKPNGMREIHGLKKDNSHGRHVMERFGITHGARRVLLVVEPLNQGNVLAEQYGTIGRQFAAAMGDQAPVLAEYVKSGTASRKAHRHSAPRETGTHPNPKTDVPTNPLGASDSELEAMGLSDRVAEIASRIKSRLGMMSGEEATKHGLVMPVLKHVFRYNPFDPNDVAPEFVCDVGTKRGERVDYALMKDGEPTLLIECKAHGAPLSDAHMSQLFRYFATSASKFAALTNGTAWWFYSDTDEVNKMDVEPFFTFDFTDYSDEDIKVLRMFVKGEPQNNAVEFGWRLMMRRKMREMMAKEVANPSDDVVKMFARKVCSKRLSPTRMNNFKELVVDAFNHALGEGATSAKANPIVVLNAPNVAEADAEPINADKGKRRGPSFEWETSGVENGDELVFHAKNFAGEPPTVVMHDVARKLVRFNGDIVTIAVATNRVRGKRDTHPTQPIQYWSHNGRRLLDIYKEQVDLSVNP